ncbi:phosphate starvation protein PhoH [Clostridia bacterium]|nr:phosphate starvation protein PhoH [Clostridia bacterium]GHU77527.1 phosphate starvation protein PhoH [Clostridia bacterium]
MADAETLTIDSRIIGGVFGSFDLNIKKIENAFGVSVTNRGDDIQVSGGRVRGACTVLNKLAEFSKKGEVTEQTVNYIIAEVMDGNFSEIEKINDDVICLSSAGKPIKPKTLGQKKYIDLIRENTVVFGSGPAGTGKTYLAMAMAVKAFRAGEVSRIILTRPAIEAGESLGFLPGDLQQKVDPYLRPLYDALHDIMGTEVFLKNMEKGAIEVAPLAYMRGRTLDNSFIVLDEAQNTTNEQMKMFLTRLGFGSKAVITGDLTQIDLPRGKKSGMDVAVRILKNINGIKVAALSTKDVVRHPLVAQIIRAYEETQKPGGTSNGSQRYKAKQ